LLALILTLCGFAGRPGVYAWLVWCGFTLLLTVLFPILIAPLFNRFTPLADSELAAADPGAAGACGLSTPAALYTMDGSRRSQPRPTLISRAWARPSDRFFRHAAATAATARIEAVLAHELGQFRLRHVASAFCWVFVAQRADAGRLSWLMQRTWFYEGLGVEPLLQARNDALAAGLFFLAMPVFTFPVGTVSSLLSRRQEFEADQFAARYASPRLLNRRPDQAVQGQLPTLTRIRFIRAFTTLTRLHRFESSDLLKVPSAATVG